MTGLIFVVPMRGYISSLKDWVDCTLMNILRMQPDSFGGRASVARLGCVLKGSEGLGVPAQRQRIDALSTVRGLGALAKY